jgi:signal transduction histidine kinase
VLLSAVIGTAFILLALAIGILRGSESQANHALEVLVAANRLERVAIDIETTAHDFVITGAPRFLQPWRQAQAAFTQQAAALERLASAGDEGQGYRARQITAAGKSYIRDYSVPLVTAAQHNLGSARSVAVTEAGNRREDALQSMCEQFTARENQISVEDQDRAVAYAVRVLVAASAGVGGSIVLILFSGGYLTRSVIRPVRRASAMAGRVAGGDLSVRMPESGPGEVGSLERSFNSMADSLEASRDELRRVADEQAALRRVATLVARAAPPEEVLAAVTEEAGRLLGTHHATMSRYDPDGTITVVAAWSSTGAAFPVGTRVSLGGRNLHTLVFQAGRAARIDDYTGASGPAGEAAREFGIRASVGVPVSVEGRLWGVMIVESRAEPLPAGTEARLAGFTELTATAIANAEAQAALATSRARIVATADQTRRRIERDLHDGAQQQLVSLALQLRTAQAAAPPGAGVPVQELEGVAAGLDGVLEELREIAHGLHPAILAERGLSPALQALARRSAVPVRLEVQVEGRLPEQIEIAAYYVVAEALTNAAKHAHAAVTDLEVAAGEGVLRVSVRDDGRGGADFGHGSGLVGLRDRVEALGGRLWLHSPPGEGTTLQVQLPMGQARPSATDVAGPGTAHSAHAEPS